MTFCASTPTRGDRPEFLEHCKWQIKRMELEPDEHIIVDFPPTSPDKDILARLRLEIAQAWQHEQQGALVAEDDDSDPPDYFQRMYDAASACRGYAGNMYHSLRDTAYNTE